MRESMKIAAGGLALVLMSSVALPGAALAEDIEFSTWQAEEGGFGIFWHEVTEAFEEAHPEHDVSITQIPYSDYVNQLTIRFASGRPPQLMELPSEFMAIFASQGWLAPLDERIEGSRISDQWSPLQSEMTWNGETVGVLIMGGAYVLFYNEALLEEAGLSKPTSYEDYIEMLPQLTDRDAGVFGLSAVTAQHPTIALDLMRTIRWSGTRLIEDGAYKLTDPDVVAALERYRKVVGNNAALGNNSSMSRQAFVDGRTAFMVDGPWVYATVQKAPEEVRDDLKIMEAPFPVALGGAVNSMHIPAANSGAQKDAAWEFIEFMSQPEWQKRWAVLTMSPPAMAGAITDDIIAKEPALETIAAAAENAESVWPSDELIRSNLNEFRSILTEAGMRLLSTETSAQTIAAETQAELERTFPLS